MPNIVNSLIKEIINFNKLQAKFLDASLKMLSKHDLDDLELYLQYCLSNGLDLEYLARSYDVIVKDTVKEQLYFKKYGKYRHSTYEEVSSHVYLNKEYMEMYMHGLALTSFLWPNHSQMKTFLQETIPRNIKGRYLEVGPGHGLYLITAMKLSSYDFFEGVDISPTSVKMTNSILGSRLHGDFSNYRIYEGDFLEEKLSLKYNAIVMGEVLEHVENPGAFLQKIHNISHIDSYIYITTCINAPAIDHIYLFEHFEQLERLITDADLYIENKLLVPYSGMTIEESEKQRLPINVAMILGR